MPCPASSGGGHENALLDFSPSLPMGTRVLVGLLGIRRGLRVRRMIAG
jgi:hypothetical protein